MMEVTICGPNLRDQRRGQFHIHAADCADLTGVGARREPEYADGWTVDVESRAEIVREIYPPGDFDYDPAEWRDLDDMYVFPCCTGLPDEEA